MRICHKLKHTCTFVWFRDNSSTGISSTTLRLLLYTRVEDSYTSNFCFSKSLLSSIPTSTYTIFLSTYNKFIYLHLFINPTSTDTMIIQHIILVSKHCGMTTQLVLSVKDAYFYQSHI